MRWFWPMAFSLFLAHTANAGMEVTMSGYASCSADAAGGKDESKWAQDKLRPSQMALSKSPKYVMIGVSRVGGTNPLRKQCFTASGGEGDGKFSNGYLSTIHSVIFVAADQCNGCNNKNQVDVATPCGSKLSGNLTVNNVKLEETDCPKEIQAAMTVPDPSSKPNGTRKTASASRSRSTR